MQYIYIHKYYTFHTQGTVVSILEAAALTGFVILVATNLGPAKTILLTPGVFLMTAFFGMFPCFCSAEPSYCQSDEESGSSDAETSGDDRESKSLCRECCKFLMNSTFAKLLAFCLQAGGIITTSFLLLYFNTDRLSQEKRIDFLAEPWSNALRLSLSVVVICPLLSFLWSGLVKGFIFKFKHNTRYSNLGQLEGKPGRPASRRGGEMCYIHIQFSPSMIKFKPMYTQSHTLVHIHICMHTHLYTYTHACTHTHTHTHTYNYNGTSIKGHLYTKTTCCK